MVTKLDSQTAGPLNIDDVFEWSLFNRHQTSVRMNGKVTDNPAGTALSDCVTRSA